MLENGGCEGEVVVDDHLYFSDVDASFRNVGGDKNFGSALLEEIIGCESIELVYLRM